MPQCIKPHLCIFCLCPGSLGNTLNTKTNFKKIKPEIQLGTSHLSVDAQNGRHWTPSTGGDAASEVAEGQWGDFRFLTMLLLCGPATLLRFLLAN